MARLAGAAVALLWLFCGLALAQQEPEVRLLGMNSLHASIEGDFIYQSDELTDKEAGSKTLSLQQSFIEILSLSGDGYIYHPRFLTFSGTIGLSLQQGEDEVQTSVQNQSGSLNGFAPQYSLSGVLLGQHRISLGFAVNKSTTYTVIPFWPLTTTQDENQQLTLSIKSATLPTQFTFSHDDNSQTQFGFGEDRSEDITNAGFNTLYKTAHSTTTFSYLDTQDYEKEQEVSLANTLVEVQRYIQDAEFNSIWRFGPQEWGTLTSRGSYREETGTYPNSLASWQESLLLKHTPDLSSHYAVDFTRTTVAGQESDLTAAEASLTHQLYQSLTSTARVYGTYETFGDTTEDTYGFSLAENYRKNIPWGVLTINLGGGYQITNDQTQPGIVSVLRESHTLSDTTITFLNNPNVLIGSIVVTDSTGLHTYVLNTDYQLIPIATLIQVRRLPFGAILNGASVLVNYEYQNDLPIEYSTRDIHGRIQLDLFDHLSLYAYRLSLPETLISGVNQGELQSLQETLVGASLHFNPATLTAEHEIYQSTIAPYTSDMVTFNMNFPLNEIQRIGGNASYHHVTFEQIGQGSETTRNVGLSYQLTPRKWPSVNASVGYEWDTEPGLTSQYAYAHIRFDYHLRNTTFALDIEINQQNEVFEKELSEYVFFSVKRDIF